MSIRRGKRPQTDFTMILNSALRDESLTYRARGIMAYVLTHAEEWQTGVEDIASHGVEGRDAVRTCILELEEAGYLVRERRQDALGHWHVDYILNEIPARDGNPVTENPSPEKPSPDSRTRGHRSVSTKKNTSEDHSQKTSLSEDGALAGARAPEAPAALFVVEADEPAEPSVIDYAKELLQWWWERQEPRPAGRGAWHSGLASIRAVLEAGWSPAQVGAALKDVVPPLSVGSLEFSLNSGRRVDPKTAQRRSMVGGWLADADSLDQQQPHRKELGS